MLQFALRMIHVIHSRGLVFVKENILRLVPPLKKKIVHFALQDITRVFVKENIRCFLPPLKKKDYISLLGKYSLLAPTGYASIWKGKYTASPSSREKMLQFALQKILVTLLRKCLPPP